MVGEYLAELDRDHEGDVEIVADHVKFLKTELASMADTSKVVHVRVVVRDYDGARGEELNPFIKNVQQQVPDVRAVTFKDVPTVVDGDSREQQ